MQRFIEVSRRFAGSQHKHTDITPPLKQERHLAMVLHRGTERAKALAAAHSIASWNQA